MEVVMSQAVLRQTTGAATGSTGLGAMLARVADYVRQEWQVGLAMGDAARLDERALHDIGMSPCGIEHAVRHGRARSQASQASSPLGASPLSESPVALYRGMPPSFTEWR
jgi:hypothetical protein